MIICVEGPSGGGKSTLIEDMPERYARCPPVSDLLGGYPVCQPGAQGVTENFSRFVKGELLAAEIMMGDNLCWIQDRSWISQVTFLVSVAHCANVETRTMVLNIADLLEAGRLLVPNVILYMRCPPELTAERRQLRGSTQWGDVPYWLSPADRLGFRTCRHLLFEKLLSMPCLNVIAHDAACRLSGHEAHDLIQRAGHDHTSVCIREVIGSIAELSTEG